MEENSMNTIEKNKEEIQSRMKTPPKRRKKLKAGDVIFDICNGIFMLLFCIVTLYPVLNTLAISFNDGVDAMRGGVHLIPRLFTTQNYTTVFALKNITQGAIISVLVTVQVNTPDTLPVLSYTAKE